MSVTAVPSETGVPVRLAPMGLTVSEHGSWYSTLVRAETKGAAIIESYRVAAGLGYLVKGLNQATEQLPDAPGRWYVEVAVER